MGIREDEIREIEELAQLEEDGPEVMAVKPPSRNSKYAHFFIKE